MTDAPIGQLALLRGWISQDQLDAALARQQELEVSEPNRFRRLGHLLVKQGVLTPVQVLELLSEQGIALFRSEGSGRQYNVHQADTLQTYLSPEDSTPMRRVDPSDVRKVLVFDDINRPSRSDAPVERIVAPPGALEAVPQTSAPEPVSTPTPPVTERRGAKPSLEEILARSPIAEARPEGTDSLAKSEQPNTPVPSAFVPLLDQSANKDDAPPPSEPVTELKIGTDDPVHGIPVPQAPPSLFDATTESDNVESDDSVPAVSDPAEPSTPEALGDPLLSEPVDADDSEPDEINIFAPRPSERSDVDIDMSAFSRRKASDSGAAPSHQLFAVHDSDADSDAEEKDESISASRGEPVDSDVAKPLRSVAPQLPTADPEFGSFDDGVQGNEPADPPALTPAVETGETPSDEPQWDLAAHDDSSDAKLGNPEFQIASLADDSPLNRPGLEELQAPAEQVEYDATVPPPDTFPDLAPGSASTNYAIDDAPEPEGGALGDSLLDGGLTRPKDGFGLGLGESVSSGHDEGSVLHVEDPFATEEKNGGLEYGDRAKPIHVTPLDESDSQDVAPVFKPGSVPPPRATPGDGNDSDDDSAENPMPAESAEVRRVTGMLRRTDQGPASEPTPFDNLDDFDDLRDDS